MQMTWENPDDIVEKVLQELSNGKPISDLQPLISERIVCFDSCQFLWIKRVDMCQIEWRNLGFFSLKFVKNSLKCDSNGLLYKGWKKSIC